MARDDDDDDSLPPLGENTDKFLEQAKKGQSRNFLLVCKGNKVKYLAVRKKPIKKNELNEAKKSGYKGEGYIGVITGKGMELIFNLSTADGYTAEPVKDKILKEFLEEKADFKCKPTIAIVATLPDIPFDDEDLSNPLVARFLALGERISDVLDVRPEAESELTKTATEIRLLLQDGEFQTAEPLVNALDTRLRELLSDGQANSPAPPPFALPPAPPVPPSATTSSVAPPAPAPPAPAPPAPAPPAPAPPPQSVDNDALKLKLQEALNKLVPQLKQAVLTYPEKKVELLTPVAQIKKQMEAGDLQEAKKGILAVGQLLKSVMSQTTTQSTSESQPQAVDPLRADYESKLAALQPSYDKALQDMLGDTSKFRTVMAYAMEQAEAGSYGNAIKALARLTQAVDQAIAEGVKETDVIPENVVADRKKFLQSRWQEAVKAAYAEIDKIIAPIISQVPGEDAQQLVSAIAAHLDGFVDELNQAIVGAQSATSANMKPIQAALKAIQWYRTKITSDPLLMQLDEAGSELGVAVNVSEGLTTALAELEQNLAS